MVLIFHTSSTLAETHDPIATLAERAHDKMPKVTTLIVACMDHRCIPEKFFGLDVGEALVVRNLGGSARSAIREIAFIDQVVGLDEIAVIHHTDCGTSHFTDTSIQKKLRDSFPDAKGNVDWMQFTHIDK